MNSPYSRAYAKLLTGDAALIEPTICLTVTFAYHIGLAPDIPLFAGPQFESAIADCLRNQDNVLYLFLIFDSRQPLVRKSAEQSFSTCIFEYTYSKEGLPR